MRAWSCITSYPLRGLPYLVYDNVNPAVVNSMMLRSSMLAFEKVYYALRIFRPILLYTNREANKNTNLDLETPLKNFWIQVIHNFGSPGPLDSSIFPREPLVG